MINMEAIPKFDIKSVIKSDIKFDISTKLTTWIGHISENSTTRLVLVCFIGAVVNHPNNLILTVALPSASREHAVLVYKKQSDMVEIQPARPRCYLDFA